MHVQLMRPAWPGEMGLRADVADIAGEALGDDHDLACLETLIVTDPGAIGSDEDIALLRIVMTARSAALHEQIRGIVKNLLRDDKRVVRKKACGTVAGCGGMKAGYSPRKWLPTN